MENKILNPNSIMYDTNYLNKTIEYLNQFVESHIVYSRNIMPLSPKFVIDIEDNSKEIILKINYIYDLDKETNVWKVNMEPLYLKRIYCEYTLNKDDLDLSIDYNKYFIPNLFRKLVYGKGPLSISNIIYGLIPVDEDKWDYEYKDTIAYLKCNENWFDDKRPEPKIK